jgi:hypothetical protein
MKKYLKIGLQILLCVFSHSLNSSVFEYAPLQYLFIIIVLVSTYLLWKEATIDILSRSIMIISIIEGLMIYVIDASNVNLQETLRDYINQYWALPVIILITLSGMLLQKIIKRYQTR